MSSSASSGMAKTTKVRCAITNERVKVILKFLNEFAGIEYFRVEGCEERMTCRKGYERKCLMGAVIARKPKGLRVAHY